MEWHRGERQISLLDSSKKKQQHPRTGGKTILRLYQATPEGLLKDKKDAS